MSAENARRLESAVITSLTLDGLPTETEILSLARQLRRFPSTPLAMKNSTLSLSACMQAFE